MVLPTVAILAVCAMGLVEFVGDLGFGAACFHLGKGFSVLVLR